jgi:hypothetical protein
MRLNLFILWLNEWVIDFDVAQVRSGMRSEMLNVVAP